MKKIGDMMLYKLLVKKISIPTEKKNKQKEYLKKGKLPIIDQGKKLIGGYSDDEKKAIVCNLPVIIFGDHTKVVKYINFEFGAGADGIKVLEPKENVLPKYLYFGTQYLTFKIIDKGYARHYQHIEKKDLPVPSLEEQERIVSRIEELFSQLDSGVEILKKTKEQLAVYRQAVLKEAFETAYLFDSKPYTINDLLSKERKGMTTGPFGTMLKKREHQLSGIPVLGIENIGKEGFINRNKIFVTPAKAEELKAFTVHTNDLIISRSGTVGEICIVPEYMNNALLSTNLMRISLNFEVIKSEYFMYLFKSKGVVIDQVKELCKGSTRMFLNQTILKQIVFPVPDVKVQTQIIELIESRLSICDSIEKTIDVALQEAEALRQSLLKQAFEGGL